jgi:hypothetical protein
VRSKIQNEQGIEEEKKKGAPTVPSAVPLWQKVKKKLSINCQKVVKKLSKSCQKAAYVLLCLWHRKNNISKLHH